ncbi:hypothetical protein NM688_g3803 [Phlebia brevispora]|uniref:Uncharacterized protein n=1 Tax=Phlebia brevispora TaxID=194682 RepID=A0ACC1T5D4_9APHY|nr:hypothetical protein NM688_g3803 [Phlebia brevispora]
MAHNQSAQTLKGKKRTCDICGLGINARGFINHRKACERAAEARRLQKEAEEALQERRKRARERADSTEQPDSKKQKSGSPSVQVSPPLNRVWTEFSEGEDAGMLL